MEVKNYIQSKLQGLGEQEKRMVAGGVAGSVGKTVTAPLSRLTVLYQVGPLLPKAGDGAKSATSAQESLLAMTRRILRKEGFLSFWKGNFTSVIHRFPYSAINFASFETSRDFCCKRLNMQDDSKLRFVCGAISGAVACISCYPLDLVRTKLTVSDASLQNYTPAFHNQKGIAQSTYRLLTSSKIIKIWSQILQNEGVLGLYRGLSVSLLVSVPSLAIGFSVYGWMKDHLLRYGDVFVNKEGKLTAYGSLLSGSVSGMFSSMLMFPVDVVRKRMQVASCFSPTSTDTPVNRPGSKFFSTPSGVGTVGSGVRLSAMDIFLGIVKKEGMSGLYRGLVPEQLKVTPMVAVTFCMYEMTSNFMNPGRSATSSSGQSGRAYNTGGNIKPPSYNSGGRETVSH